MGMKVTRVVVAVVLAGALALAASRASARTTSDVSSIPCTAAALGAAYHSLDSVQNFGCVGGWAFLWATVGSGEGEVGVTEVEHYDAATSAWANASRLTYCTDHRLPNYVSYWGCNSN